MRQRDSVFRNEEMKISVRKNGPSGLVKIEVYSLLDGGGDFTRGESGAEKTLRETFTRNLEPQSKFTPNYKPISHGITTEHFGQGESKTISVQLPNYNWTHHLSGQVMHVAATGVLPQKVGGQ